jgi:hypothetical protein
MKSKVNVKSIMLQYLRFHFVMGSLLSVIGVILEKFLIFGDRLCSDITLAIGERLITNHKSFTINLVTQLSLRTQYFLALYVHPTPNWDTSVALK